MQQPPTTGSASQTGAPQPTTQSSSNQTASGTAGELKSDARQLGEKAKDRLHSEVDNRKSTAVSQAQSFSSAIEQTAGNLDENTPDWLKSALRQGAQKIQQFAETIEQKDSRQLMTDAQDFARNNPGTFLAACAAAGFAAARIFKAGSDQQSTQYGSYDQSQPWGDGEVDTLGQDSGRDWGRSDTFGQQFDESSTGAPSSSTQGGLGGGSNQAFMARPETQSPTSSEFEQNRMEDDPLILGSNDAPVTSDGDIR